MRPASPLPLMLVAFLAASCATVPRDAGLADVQQTVEGLSGQRVEWRPVHLPDELQQPEELLADDLTADAAVAVAMLQNPRLQLLLADLGIARADLIEASSVANPLLELELRWPGHPYRPYEVRLAQSLMQLVQLPRRRAAGRDAFDAAQMRVSAEVLGFAGDVRAAYYEMLAASQQVAFSRTILESSQTAAELALKQHHAGNITDLDLEIQQALYEQSKLETAGTEQRLLVAHERFVRMTGLTAAGGAWRLPAAFPPLPDAEMEQERLESLAAEQRLDLAIARRELEVAARSIPLARLALLEHLEVAALYERESSGERLRGAGIELPIPIFNSGRAARVRAEAGYMQARYRLAVLEAEAASLLRTARAGVAEARARVEYYREVVVPRRQRILQLTKMEANAMLIGLYQLLEAREDLLQAQRESIDAQRDYWTARVGLDRALQGVAEESSFRPAGGQPAAAGRRGNNRGDH